LPGRTFYNVYRINVDISSNGFFQKEIVMKRITRFSIAVIVVGILALIATGVWASPKFNGTVPPVPPIGGGSCNNTPQTIDMGTALFTPLGTICTIEVKKVDDPASVYIPATGGHAFVGDTFDVNVTPDTIPVKVCYAFPPEFGNKNVNIHKLNEVADPHSWDDVQGSSIGNGVICVTTTSGVFSLIQNP